MTNPYTKAVVAEFLRAKLANEQLPMPPQAEDAHEASETPQEEMLEHAGGAGEGAEGHPEGLEGGEGHHAAPADVEHLLSQLSPEELDHLATQLSEDHEGPSMPHEGGEDLGGLSHNIEQHLAQNPEAAVEGAPPEKAAALSFVKSASYIEGFLTHAVSQGASVKQAVDLYDEALTEAIVDLQKSAGIKDIARKAAKEGKKLVKKVTKPVKDMQSDIRWGKAAKRTAGAAGLAVGYNAAASLSKGSKGSKEKEKEAAYYDGLFERANEYGFDNNTAANFIELAIDKQAGLKDLFRRKNMLDKAKDVAEKGVKAVKKQYKKDPLTTTAAGVGIAGGAAGLASLAGSDSDKEKKAAYCEGIYKRALAYGYSEQEAFAFVENALNS